MVVELLLAPGWPNAPEARAVLAECLHGLGLDVAVLERVGEFASPTILVDGIDAMTGTPGAQVRQACRLDLPTAARVHAALQAAATEIPSADRSPVDEHHRHRRPTGGRRRRRHPPRRHHPAASTAG